MEAINISKKKFATLEKYNLPSNVANTECQLYVINDHEKWENKRYLLKKLYIDKGEYFGNKLLTINTLIDNKEEIGIDELVLPDRLAVVNKNVVGFTIPLIENSINMTSLLNSYDISNDQKISYLKQVGAILKRVKNVRKFKNNFFLGDVHEGNFIVDKQDNIVRAVDLDSCKIGNNQPFPSKYLAVNPNVDSLSSKYPKNENNVGIPNANTELLCYNLMILNFISRGPVYKMPIEEYYLYLEYLRDIGFPNELLDCFAKLYVYCENQSPDELLDLIPKDINKAGYNVFKYKMRNK